MKKQEVLKYLKELIVKIEKYSPEKIKGIHINLTEHIAETDIYEDHGGNSDRIIW